MNIRGTVYNKNLNCWKGPLGSFFEETCGLCKKDSYASGVTIWGASCYNTYLSNKEAGHKCTGQRMSLPENFSEGSFGAVIMGMNLNE